MKIPSKVKIGASKIKVCVVDSAELDGGEVLGVSNAAISKILISTSFKGKHCSEDSMTDTFLHEIIHMISQNMGIGLTERQVVGVAGGLLMVIRDNNLDFRDTTRRK
jgi:hypothetical protein